MEPAETFARLCFKYGVPAPSPERRQIADEVFRFELPTNAEEIYQRIATRHHAISRSTVFRTVSMLEDVGMLVRCEQKELPTYRLAHRA